MRFSVFPFVSVFALSTSALAEDISVTEAADRGPGTLRAALQAAADSPDPSTISIDTKDAIVLKTGLSYLGSSDLQLIGNGATIQAETDATILGVHSAGMVSISGLQLEGPGGWSIKDRSDVKDLVAGLDIRATEAAAENFVVHLSDVSVKGVSGYGVYVSDCAVSDCEKAAAKASISVFANNLHVENNGHGRYNADGLRVEEYGLGDLRYVSVGSRYIHNGADGAELDEYGPGNLLVSLSEDLVEANGFYCATDILAAALPDVIEAEFEGGALQVSQLPDAISGSADDACIEFEVDRYDDGSVEAYEFEIDVEDGFDVSERGDGSVYVTMDNVVVKGNDDEGLDFDEYDTGDIYGHFRNNIFEDNADDGLKLCERDDGATTAFVHAGRAAGNGDRGYLIEEEGDGNLYAVIANVTAERNGNSGIEAVQEDGGFGRAKISKAKVDNEVELDGVEQH